MHVPVQEELYDKIVKITISSRVISHAVFFKW